MPQLRNAADLSGALCAFVGETLEALEARHAPGLVLPNVFAGHPVGPDTRADLAFTVGLLHEAGREEIGATPIEPAVLATLRSLDGKTTDTFYSYRAAESLLRFGGYHGNARLADWSQGELAELRLAVDSSDSMARLREGAYPVNYAIVLARCEHAREALGLLDDPAILDELMGRSRDLLARAGDGWIDDSNEQRGQFDIYTADMFLFAEPLAGRLGDVWSNGLRRVLRDVDALALPGGAIVWGRSIGALGLAMTIELAAVGVGRGLVDGPGPWLARAAWALEELRAWFSDGVIRAHQRRSTMFYRGPARRLQMTLDILGKLVQAALELGAVGDVELAPAAQAFADVDRYVRFGRPGANEAAGAWAHRERRLSFVLPLIGGYSSDYLPAPRSPGLFETPTTGPISMVPVVHRKGKALVAAGAPASVEHRDGEVEVRYDGWAEVAAGPGVRPVFGGGRTTRFRVDGRSLVVDERLTVEGDLSDVSALALHVPALAARPLDVVFEADTPQRVNRIDVDGLAEYRSFWSEISTVHQVDLDPAPEVSLRWTVTPQLCVRSTAYDHPYDGSLYGPLSGRLVEKAAPGHLVSDARKLASTDLLHLHWPEWWQGRDPASHHEAIARLKDAGVRVVWTQHNLRPHHFKDDDAHAVYQLWAAAADGVIHHTEWGRGVAQATYDYAPEAIHRVIPHGHWGARVSPHALVPREKVEADLGLAPCAIRLGIVGAPRVEKNVQRVLDAFHACSRDDMQLLVVCIEDEDVPEDPRITTLPARLEPEHVYYQRLNAIDVLVLPFDEGMMLTGTAFDAIGAGMAALVSPWPALAEVLGDAGIPYGETAADLTACLESLTAEQVAAAGRVAASLQARSEWRDSAEKTLALFEEVVARD